MANKKPELFVISVKTSDIGETVRKYSNVLMIVLGDKASIQAGIAVLNNGHKDDDFNPKFEYGKLEGTDVTTQMWVRKSLVETEDLARSDRSFGAWIRGCHAMWGSKIKYVDATESAVNRPWEVNKDNNKTVKTSLDDDGGEWHTSRWFTKNTLITSDQLRQAKSRKQVRAKRSKGQNLYSYSDALQIWGDDAAAKSVTKKT